MRRPRLVVLTTDCPPSLGGIQRIVHELGNHLTPRWEVTVIAPRDLEAGDHDRDSPYRIVRTGTPWGHPHARLMYEMTRHARSIAAEVVLSMHVNLLPVLVACGRARPLVAVVHGSELWAPRTRVITRALGRRMGRVMAVSQFTASEAARAGIPAERIAVTPPGASVPPATPQGDAILGRLRLEDERGVVPFFLTVARLSQPHKGHDMFIRAMPALLRHDPRVRYVVAGEGALLAQLSDLAKRLEVSHAVHFAGPVDEPEKGALLRACRAFVMASREMRRPPLFEGFGIVYIEAALAGRPSLGGRSGGIPDAVVDGETGLLVEPRSLTEITEAASRLLDADYADRLGRQARERAKADFTWERAVARFERCLESASP